MKYLFLFSWLFFLANSVQAIDHYQLVDLGLLSYQTSAATGINNQGQVCGTYKASDKTYVFIWDPLQNKLNYWKIRTSAKPLINNHSEIFGSQWRMVTDDVWDFDQEIVFFWTNPLSYFTLFNVKSLGYPKDASKSSPFDQERTVVWDVNDLGQLVIMNTDSIKDFFLGNPMGFKYRVWIYDNDGYKRIRHPQVIVGSCINNSSQVLGAYSHEVDVLHKDRKIGTSIYDIRDGTIRILQFPASSFGRSLNDLGCVTGVYYDPLINKFQGFLSDSSSDFITIDNFGPYKINNCCQIVGIFLEGEKKDKPAIWDNGELYDLSDLVSLVDDQGHLWDSIDAVLSLNDEGYLIGRGRYDGANHGFMLRPIRELSQQSSQQD